MTDQLTTAAKTITIDLSDESSVAAAIAAGITTPELMADVIDDAELVDDCLVLSPGTWHADDGTAEIVEDFDSGEEAAQNYVDTGDWSNAGDEPETCWIDVRVWRSGIDADGEIVRVDKEKHTITLEPEEPKCTGNEHDWQSPFKIVGGCKENPGVWGNGGGVIITEACMNCGCGKHTDTWAQNPNNGQQGLRSVRYVPEEFAERVQAMREEPEAE